MSNTIVYKLLKTITGCMLIFLSLYLFLYASKVKADIEIDNTDIAIVWEIVSGDIGVAAFLVSEQAGNTDLNADGDFSDEVIHTYDLATGEIINLGLHVFNTTIKIKGDFMVFDVWETKQGNQDLNGDGDSSDPVPHYMNLLTGEVTNTGLAGSNAGFSDNGFIGIYVREAKQGFVDLNGDGDTNDAVGFVHDTATGTNVNLETSANGMSIHGNHFALMTYEPDQGNVDLNGDGDDNDFVLHVFDSTTGIIENIGISGYPRYDVDVIALQVNEYMQGATDFNGDGDLNDFVFQVYDTITGLITNFELATTITSPMVGSGNLVGFIVHEGAQGNVDLNGDGDVTDYVGFVYDHSLGALTNLGIAVSRDYGFKIDGNYLAFLVEEGQEGQFGSDLNGDGDKGDRVLHLYDTVSGITTNIGLAIWSSNFSIHGGLLTFQVSENRQGLTDYNGDGDFIDNVLHSYNLVDNSLINYGIDARPIGLEGITLVTSVREFSSTTDLNGDGDYFDPVLHLLDIETNELTNLEIAVYSPHLIGPKILAPIVESAQGNTDLNGDGDTLDSILNIIDPFAEPVATIANLVEKIIAAQLAHGTENALLAKLSSAQASFDSSNIIAGLNNLEAFINQVEALSGKKIEASLAGEWIGIALLIIAENSAQN